MRIQVVKALSLAFTGSLAVALTGCSVVTVDVDVYKGPLANHEEVQLQQAAVMAAGAKPLLVRLRDSLECNSQSPKNLAEFRKANESWYLPRFIPNGSGGQRLTNDHALRVNAILALYEGDDSSLRELLRSVEMHLESAITNYAAFQFTTNDNVLWNDAVLNNLRTNAPLQARFLEYTVGTTNPNPILPNSRELVAGSATNTARPYTYRPTLTEMEATNVNVFASHLDQQQRDRLDARLRTLHLPRNYSGNHIFVWFINRELLRIHSDALFTNRTPAVENLESRWHEVAQAFLNGRENLKDATRDSLHALAELSEPGSAPEMARKDLVRELVDLLTFIINADKLTEIVFTEPLLQKSGIHEFLKTNATLNVTIPSKPKLNLPRQQANELLRRYLIASPREGSRELLLAHQLSLEGSETRPPYPFGLGDTLNERDPVNRVTEFTSLARRSMRELAISVRRIESGAGLDGGRLNTGLEELTRNFISATTESEKETSKKRLMEELTRFSEKVLFLANNEILMRPSYWRGIGRTLGRWTWGATIGFDKLTNPPDGGTYSQVLQVIANSILVEVDELYQRREHDTNDTNLGGVHARRGYEQAYDVSSEMQLQLWKRLLSGPPFVQADLDELRSKETQAVTDRTTAVARLTTSSNAFVLALTNLLQASNSFQIFTRITNSTEFAVIIAKGATTKNAERKAITNSIADLRPGSGDQYSHYTRLKETLAPLPLTDADVSTDGLTVLRGYARDLDEALSEARKNYEARHNENKENKDASDKADEALKKIKTAIQEKELIRDNGLALKELERLTAGDFVQKRPVPGVLWEDLRAQLRAEPAANQSAKLLSAFLQRSKPVSNRMPPASPKDTKPKHVLDQLIASLRYEYTRSVLDEGQNSESAQRISDALNAALEQRAGMIYIRPASSYLRTSFPSTSLQQGTKMGWRNMLAEHGRRQLPFASLFESTKKTRVLQEIDKQFWQNVNQVRVAGAGSGNYAIAKDDLGNWYVKNYSANPERIIKSAQNLAMFSLGPQLGAALPIQSGSTGAILAGATNGMSPAQGPVGTQLDQTLATYNTETLKTYKALAKDAKPGTLGEAIQTALATAAMSAAASNSVLAVEQNARKSLVELPAELEKDKKAQDEILRALKSLNRYRNALLTSAARLAAQDDQKKAKDAVEGVLKPAISGSLEERIDTVARAKERVALLSDITRK